MSSDLLNTLAQINPDFQYVSQLNPRRVLTKPCVPMHNNGNDNDDYDYILYVNDVLGDKEGHRYIKSSLRVTNKISNNRSAWPRDIWTSGQVQEYFHWRIRCSQSNKKQACVLPTI